MIWNSAGREMCIRAVFSESSPSLADDSPYITIANEMDSMGCCANCVVHAGCVWVSVCASWEVNWLDAEPRK